MRDLDLRLRLEGLDERFGLLLLLLLREELPDVAARLGERHDAGRAVLGPLDDVKAVLGLDQPAHLPGLERERDVAEGRHHLRPGEEAQVAAVRRAAGILRELLCQGGEIAPGLDLRQHRAGLRARLGLRGCVGILRVRIRMWLARIVSGWLNLSVFWS